MKKLTTILLLAPLFVFGQTKMNSNQINTRPFKADSVKAGNPLAYVNTHTGLIFYFGDSITAYAGATDSTFSYSYLVSHTLGLSSRNYGQSGSTLEKRSPINWAGGGATNMIDEISKIPTYVAGTTQYLVFMWGINDWQYGGTNYTPTNFTTDYTTVMNAVVSAGWPMSRVVITSLTYSNPSLFGTTGSGGGTLTQVNKNLFSAAASGIATTFGCNYVELDSYLNNRGATADLFDNLHPNNYGHYLYAQAVLSGLVNTVYSKGQAITANGITETQKLILDDNTVVPYSTGVPMGIDPPTGNTGVLNSLPTGFRLGTDPIAVNKNSGNFGLLTTGYLNYNTTANNSNLLLYYNSSTDYTAIGNSGYVLASPSANYDAAIYGSQNLLFATGIQNQSNVWGEFVKTTGEYILQGGGTYTATPSSRFTVKSTTKGSIPWPSMTTTQQNAISSPAEGLTIYDNVLHAPAYYNGTAWTAFGGGGGSGTVTSIAATGANGIGVSGSPVTTSGTLALSLGNITPTTISTTIKPATIYQTAAGTAGTDSIMVKHSGGIVDAISPTYYPAATTTVAGFPLTSNVTLAGLSATDGTLTFSGSYTGATVRTIGINLANNNTWTGFTQYNASVTASAALGQGTYFFNGVSAAANNDVLIGTDFANTFVQNSKTGLTIADMRVKAGGGSNINILLTRGGTGNAAIAGTANIYSFSTATPNIVMDGTSATAQFLHSGTYFGSIGDAAGNMTSGTNSDLGIGTSNNIVFSTGGTAIKGKFFSTGRVFIGTSPTDNGTDIIQAKGSIISGIAGTTIGTYNLAGNTSGTISIKPQAAAGTYEFDMPTTAGTAGQVLTSQGGAGTAMTWTSTVKGHTIFTPTTGGTVTLVNNQTNVINPAGSLVTLTVNLPSSPANDDRVVIKYTQAITTVTYANGTVVDGITAPTAGGLVVLVYDSGTTSWY